MQTVYALYSFPYDRLYIGRTSNLITRFHSHNSKSKKGYTMRYRPWYVIHTEIYKTIKEASVREKQLKSGKGREWLRKEILPKYL